ncbi:MAG: SBBP repeat-containing protein, partial [Thermoplasmata archaeon]|nr:SBBP repeat-containing protein [Thermoplasmata archaeon]
RGSDPSRWVTQISNYRTVVYPELWDGIDLAFHFADGQLKYEFTVSPGAEPSAIMMAYEGIDSQEVCRRTGDLIVRAGGLILRDRAPISYQDVDGVLGEVPTEFLLRGGGRVGFDIGHYEPDLALTIDPGMMFSTFLGESGDDVGYDVTVDGDGNVYVAGRTSSSDFPLTAGAYDTRFMNSEAFVSKFSSDGSSLVYSTFIGGDQDEEATGVAVDKNGLVSLTGTTYSSNFPTTSGAFCETRSGERDAFALKLNVTGSSLEFSTYLGGSLDEEANALDLDNNGSVYVSGWTNSSDFPYVEGSFRNAGKGLDVFVVKLNEDGSGLEYSSVIGGNGSDYANDLAIDNSGCAYFTGGTASEFYPATQLDNNLSAASRGSGIPDVFVTKLNATGTSLVFSTFIGNVDGEWGTGIDVDREGCAYVVGATNSVFFPSTMSVHPPYPENRRYPDMRFNLDSFMLKLAPSGDHLEYS